MHIDFLGITYIYIYLDLFLGRIDTEHSTNVRALIDGGLKHFSRYTYICIHVHLINICSGLLVSH